VNLPNFGDYHQTQTLSNLAIEAEDAGWDGFFIWDHIEGEQFFADPIIALAAIASRTTRIKLGTMVTPLPRRRPWKIAREMTSLDHLSKGRLIMGVGLGNPPTEYSKFGEPQATRIRAEKLDESLDIITGLWTGETFSYIGKHYQIEEMIFLPKPYQKPRIPIWVGGFWPNKLPFRRAAKYDGVYPAMSWPKKLSPLDLKHILSYIRRHRKNIDFFEVVAGGITPNDLEAGADIVKPWLNAGATWWSEDINGWRGTLEEMRYRIRNGPPESPKLVS
jgi:alkanesulfonate monooxygenase SsuD/methylene tetrahydromethanopterin reductase-like flavin-dependent oxidoreductase (luciferase family)